MPFLKRLFFARKCQHDPEEVDPRTERRSTTSLSSPVSPTISRDQLPTSPKSHHHDNQQQQHIPPREQQFQFSTRHKYGSQQHSSTRSGSLDPISYNQIPPERQAPIDSRSKSNKNNPVCSGGPREETPVAVAEQQDRLPPLYSDVSGPVVVGSDGRPHFLTPQEEEERHATLQRAVQERMLGLPRRTQFEWTSMLPPSPRWDEHEHLPRYEPARSEQ